MLVVAIAMVGSLTVLPALLGRLGDRVETLRVRRGRSRSRVWARCSARGCASRPRRVRLAACCAGGPRAALLNMHTTLLGPGDLPRDIPVLATYDKIQNAFPGPPPPRSSRSAPADVTSPRALAAFASLKRRRWPPDRWSSRSTLRSTADRTVAQIEVPLAGNGEDNASMAALHTLRQPVLPASIGRLPGVEYAVTGQTAGTHDFNTLIKHRFPLVFAFVLGLSFLLLLVTFRSLMIPLVSIALNLLSVGAAYGVLVWIFQQGHLEGLLGFHSIGAVVTWLPLFLFVVLFGLSMDYHVLIVSRIKELHDEGVPTAEAVERGIRSTAGTTTSAAAVMVAVFGSSRAARARHQAARRWPAIAVLIDATLIRAVLFPATMKLLGERNWYLPHRLRWLPGVELRAGRRGGARARSESEAVAGDEHARPHADRSGDLSPARVSAARVSTGDDLVRSARDRLEPPLRPAGHACW